jgi:hypothetical protein
MGMIRQTQENLNTLDQKIAKEEQEDLQARNIYQQYYTI